MFYNSFVTFKEWINKKFIDWRGAKTGQEGSLAEFARMVGVSHQVMTGWIYRGVVPKSHRTIHKLILAFDGEVYDILDIDPLDYVPSDDQLRPIAEMIRLFPAHLRPSVRQAVEDSLASAIRDNIPPEQIGRDMLRRLQAILDQERVNTE